MEVTKLCRTTKKYPTEKLTSPVIHLIHIICVLYIIQCGALLTASVAALFAEKLLTFAETFSILPAWCDRVLAMATLTSIE